MKVRNFFIDTDFAVSVFCSQLPVDTISALWLTGLYFSQKNKLLVSPDPNLFLRINSEESFNPVALGHSMHTGQNLVPCECQHWQWFRSLPSFITAIWVMWIKNSAQYLWNKDLQFKKL